MGDKKEKEKEIVPPSFSPLSKYVNFDFRSLRKASPRDIDVYPKDDKMRDVDVAGDMSPSLCPFFAVGCSSG